jgi:hypothetical protein
LNIEQLSKDFQEITNKTSLWKILCERDNYKVKETKPIDSLKTHYFNYEPEVGVSESIWFIKYNLEKLSWEINPKSLEIIQKLKTQNIGFLSTIETSDSEYGNEILNTLLGLKSQNFPNDVKEPVVYMWGKPFNFHKKKKKVLIFLRCFGLLEESTGEFGTSKNLKKELMKMMLLLSSTILLCANLNNKWIKELNDVGRNLFNTTRFLSPLKILPSFLVVTI